MNVNVIFNDLILKHSKSIKYIISLYFKNSMDCDDVLQEVFIHILDQLKKTNRDELARWESLGWIKVVVKNKCISILRTVNKETKIEKTMTDENQFENEINASSFSDASEIEFDKTTKIIKIRELLSVLKERDRKLIILRYFKNYSIKQIDEMLGVNNSAVYILRAIDKLKKEIGVDQFYNYFDQFDIEDEVDND
jgi:RNA polymerase sigma factor (sigma-70 family)